MRSHSETEECAASDDDSPRCSRSIEDCRHGPVSHESGGIGSYCLSERFSDFTLIVEEKRLPVHRIILDRVPYFRTLFDFPSTKNEVELADIDHANAVVFLRYTYGDEDDCSKESPFANLDLAQLLSLLRETERFLYEPLASQIEQRMQIMLVSQTLFFQQKPEAVHAALRYKKDRGLEPFALYTHTAPLLALMERDLFNSYARNTLGAIIQASIWSLFHPDEVPLPIDLTPREYDDRLRDVLYDYLQSDSIYILRTVGTILALWKSERQTRPDTVIPYAEVKKCLELR